MALAILCPPEALKEGGGRSYATKGRRYEQPNRVGILKWNRQCGSDPMVEGVRQGNKEGKSCAFGGTQGKYDRESDKGQKREGQWTRNGN